jgi:HAD superfamily hydrolase (TIGR01456 family)
MLSRAVLSATVAPARALSRCASSAVAFDVDGVLVLGGKTVPSAPRALQKLQAADIPFVFMTNGGGHVEAQRAAAFSERFGVTIEEHQICQSHTPMRALAEKHAEDLVLLVGKRYQGLKTIAASYGFRHTVTVEELHQQFPLLYPDAPPESVGCCPSSDAPPAWLDRPFGAVIAFTDPIMWGREVQICCDVLRAGGGRTAAEVGGGAAAQGQTVPLYSGCADFEYAAEFPVPRFGAGGFMFALRATFDELTQNGIGAQTAAASGNRPADHAPLRVEDFGKPWKVSYDYVNATMQARMRPGDTIKRAFMIGDNPGTDILGARNAGPPWFSVLVRSGMWEDGQPTGGADAVVDDVEAAMDLVLDYEAGQSAR